MRAPWQIWRDRRGHLSVLRIVTLAVLLVPLGLALHAAATTGLGARPLNDLIHRSGYWALMFLLATLAVTPLRRISRFGPLIDIRRMIGVGAFAYAAAHISLYFTDQSYDLLKVASEIVRRLYLTIGFIALAGLATLAATSTDAMVRRLGGERWRRLHQASYVIALLALVHYFQQTKADMSVPVFASGVFLLLMSYRLLSRHAGAKELSPAWLLALAIGSAALTFAGEAIGIAIAYRVSPLAVLGTAFDFDVDIRPGWLVLGAGLTVVAIEAATALWRTQAARPRRTAQA